MGKKRNSERNGNPEKGYPSVFLCLRQNLSLYCYVYMSIYRWVLICFALLHPMFLTVSSRYTTDMYLTTKKYILKLNFIINLLGKD